MLTQKEIKHRLIRLRNLERLYQEARDIIDPLRDKLRLAQQEIKLLREQNRILLAKVNDQQLRIEELEQMVFGHKRGKKSSEKKESKPRSKSSYQRPKPKDSEITSTKHYPIEKCPECGTKLVDKKTFIRFIEDMILPATEKFLKTVEKLIIESGYCSKCKKRYSAIPIPKAEVSLGPNVRQFTAYGITVLRLSYSQIINLIKVLAGLAVSEGEIAEILIKEADYLMPRHQEIEAGIRGQPGVHYDETTWDVQNAEQGNYAWVMTGTEDTDAIFWLGRSRGKGNAEKLKGTGNHVGITDGYRAYKNLFEYHQLCWAHPKRKLRDLKEAEGVSDEMKKYCSRVYRNFCLIYKELRQELKTSFNLIERERTKEKLKTKLLKFAAIKDFEPTKLKNIKLHLEENIDEYLTCLINEGIPCDNNKAERTLRHLVLKRRASFGSQNQRMAQVMSILYSVLLSTWWKFKDNFFPQYSKIRQAV